jgi:hypothetical protein
LSCILHARPSWFRHPNNIVTCITTIDGVWIGWLDLLTHYANQRRTYKQWSAIADLHNLQFTVTHAKRFSVFTNRILVTELKQSHCDWIYRGWLLILLQLLTSHGCHLPTTDSILILLYAIVLPCIPILLQLLNSQYQFSDPCCTPLYSHSLGSASSESELLYDWLFTADQFVLASSPLRLTATQHRKHSFPYCCRGMWPLSCLANSLGADHIENT